MNNIPLFHLAFPVHNLEQTKDFYTKILDCKIGRKSDKWIDFNFFGHQITAHLSENTNYSASIIDMDYNNNQSKNVFSKMLCGLSSIFGFCSK